jgi:hypothetical protein
VPAAIVRGEEPPPRPPVALAERETEQRRRIRLF